MRHQQRDLAILTSAEDKCFLFNRLITSCTTENNQHCVSWPMELLFGTSRTELMPQRNPSGRRRQHCSWRSDLFCASGDTG